MNEFYKELNTEYLEIKIWAGLFKGWLRPRFSAKFEFRYKIQLNSFCLQFYNWML